MPRAAHVRSLSLAVVLLLPALAHARQLTLAADDSAWRDLAGAYLRAYAKGDVEGVLSLWSARSPSLAAERKALAETFGAYEKIELTDVAVREVKAEGEAVNVRVAARLSLTKAGKTSTRTMNRVLSFVREGATWRVWAEAPPEKELAAALAAAKTEEERQHLLAAESELLTLELREALVGQGEALRSKGDYAQAFAVFGVARRVAEQTGDEAGVAAALRGIGNLHRLKGEYATAEEYFRKSLTTCEALDDRACTAASLNNIGLIYGARGDYGQAAEYHRRSLTLREALGDKAGVATSLNNLGNIYQAQGDFAQAAEYHRRSLALKEALGDRTGVASSLNNLGLAEQSRGDYAAAADYYRKSLALSEALGDRRVTAGVLTNVGNVHQLRGDHARAAESYQKALSLSEALGDRAVVARLLNNIGNVHRSQGNYAQAAEYHRKSLALKEALGDRPGIATTLSNLGNVLQLQGDYKGAAEYYQKSLALAEALGSKAGVAIALNYLGEVRQAQGDYAQAADYFQKSLALKEGLGDKEGIARTLNNTGELYLRQGRRQQALDFAGRAGALAREFDIPDELWHSQLVAGRAYASLGQTGPARRSLADAVETVEAMRANVAGTEQDSERFFENKLSPYLSMVELLVGQGEPGEALAYAERARARVLLDVLRGGRADINKAMTAQEREQERQLIGRLVSLNGQSRREALRTQPDPSRLADLKGRLAAARLEYEAFQTRLYAAHPELRVKRGDAPTLRADEAAGLLPDERSALLEYVVTEEKTYLFVLTRGDSGRQPKVVVQAFTLAVGAGELAERAGRFRRQLAEHDLLYRETAGELYRLLLSPAGGALKGKRLLTIVPDGALWELPFQALQPAPGRHLVEDCAVAYAPSLTVLREMREARGRRGGAGGPATLLAVGNPSTGESNGERLRSRLMDEPLAPLPEAEEQVKELGRLYGPERSTVYVGAEAGEARFKAAAGKYRILHLATHAVFDDASPMYSQVVLAKSEGAESEDGFLEAWEIMGLDLDADLVVLSACETARGRVGAGEGMIGLAWALFVAGSPSAVVSQWKVDAAGTTALMLEFHKGLRSGAPKAVALQQATLKILRDSRYRHPFYWAPFVLIGDAR